MNQNTGIRFDVYEKVFNTYGDTVLITPVTNQMTNLEGDNVFSDGTPFKAKGYISRRSRPWFFDKSGNVEGGDAILLVTEDITVKRFDKVTWNSNTYRVETVINRDSIGGNCAYKSCNLYLI